MGSHDPSLLIDELLEALKSRRAEASKVRINHWETQEFENGDYVTEFSIDVDPPRRSRRKLPTVRRSAELWGMWGYLLRPQTRKEVFEPALEDLRRDFALAQRRKRGKWSRRWLVLCFNWNAFLLVPSTMRAWTWAKLVLIVRGLVSLIAG